MPYKTRYELEREKWMTLPEAVVHIQMVEKFAKPNEARCELLKALTDDAFRSHRRSLIRWESEFSITGKEAPSEIRREDSPPRGKAWARAKIRWRTGKVLDPYGALEHGKWRPAWRTALLHRSQVMKLWPPADTSITAQPRDNINARSQAQKTGPQSGKQDSIVAAMKADVECHRLTIDKLKAMSDKALVAEYGTIVDAQRTTVRKARDLVMTEFDGINSVKRQLAT